MHPHVQGEGAGSSPCHNVEQYPAVIEPPISYGGSSDA